MSPNCLPTNQSIPNGFEQIGDFSLPSEPKANICQYPATCKNPAGRTIPPGQPTFFMKSQLSDIPYLLCEFCKSHVDQKPGTKIRQVHQSSNTVRSPTRSTTLHEVDPLSIRAASSASQRGDLVRPRVLAMPSVLPPPAQVSSYFAMGPPTYVPGASLSPHKGYSTAHNHYSEMKSRTRQLRLSSNPIALEVCTISYSVEAQFGKQSKVVFQIPLDGISQVDSRITGRELKALVMRSAAPHWAKGTHNYPFDPSFFTLRLFKSNVDLERDFPDLPAIYNLCLTTSGRAQGRFAYGKTVKVVLMLDAREYENVDDHIAVQVALAKEREESPLLPVTPKQKQVEPSDLRPAEYMRSNSSRWQDPHTPVRSRADLSSQRTSCDRESSYSVPRMVQLGPVTPKAASKKRTLPTSPSSPPQSPPHKRALNPTTPVPSLDSVATVIRTTSRLDEALRRHGQGVQIRHAVDFALIGITKLITLLKSGSKHDFVQFFAVPPIAYDDLFEDKAEPVSQLLEDFSAVNFGTLSYNTNSPESHLGLGRFKLCILGHASLTSPPWPGCDSRSLSVALKRPFKSCPSNPTATPRLETVAEELKVVLDEAAAWQWSCSLLDATYKYIEDQMRSVPDDPNAPLIPKMRFVNLGIAKCVHQGERASKALHGAFLVEEQIPKSLGFVRLLGNASATPCVFPTDDIRNTLAQFCAFAQHVQWIISEGRAFCSDWQGGINVATGETTLTDPQMITHPKLGPLFADGNVSHTFLAFPTEHQCDNNDFCSYFQPGEIVLPDDIPEIDTSD